MQRENELAGTAITHGCYLPSFSFLTVCYTVDGLAGSSTHIFKRSQDDVSKSPRTSNGVEPDDHDSEPLKTQILHAAGVSAAEGERAREITVMC